MRTRTVLRVALLATLAIGALPAFAGDTDCASSLAACFGTFDVSLTTAIPTSTNGTWSGSMTSSVYSQVISGQTVYTYVYSFTLNPNSVDISQITTSGAGGTDLFNSSLNWGMVTNLTSASVDDCTDTGGVGCPGGSTVGFHFGTHSFLTNPANLGPTGGSSLEYTFYAQSYLAPGHGTFTALDGGSSNGLFNGSLDPTAAPEPASLSLLGTGLLAVGGLLRKKLLS